jgi:primase-polymerase (primpol)-like protein
VRNFRRLNSIPKDLTSLNRWVRAVGKRPIRCDGRPASSTDSRTWASYKAVRDSSAGDGFGIMLGDDLACWDFDHVNLKAPPSKAVELLPDSIYAEVSSSGAGLHVFVRSSAPSFKRDGVEFYSHSRFVRMTGRRWTR